MTSTAWLALGGLGLLAWGVLRARRWLARRLRGAPTAAPVGAGAGTPPEALLHRVELRMEAIEAAQAALAARLEAQGPDDAAERRLQAMAGQILGLVRDKNASLDVALAGLDQLRARMRMLEQMGDAAEARALFERLGARLEPLEAARDRAAALETRLAGLEAGPGPYQEISDQLTRLYAQKDATVETVFARLAPLEAKLAEVEGLLAARDPAAALERFGERLEAARAAQDAAGAALGERLSALEGAENPFAEISEQLTRLYAQKDATVETVFARLGPLEAKLAEVEGMLAARDPAAALERFGERLETLQGRVSGLEGAENPFAEISDRLTRLYAQKDATVETVFARLGPLEAKLAEVEGLLAARDPAGALERFGERLEAARAAQAAGEGRLEAAIAALQVPAENPYQEVCAQLTRLYAQKDAAVETMVGRLAPLEARLAELERAEADGGAGAARAEAQAIATQLIAARAVAEETRLFSDRIALLEASLPRLSHAQALMMQALERQAAPVPGTEARPLAAVPAAAAPAAGETEAEALWRLPRVVSVHGG